MYRLRGLYKGLPGAGDYRGTREKAQNRPRQMHRLLCVWLYLPAICGIGQPESCDSADSLS